MKHELEKIKDLYHKFDVILTKQQKWYGMVVLVATILAAVVETLGVSAILPVVQGLLDTESLKTKWYIEIVTNIIPIQSTRFIIYLVCGEVMAVYIVKNLYFIWYNWLTRKYTYKIRRELGTRVMNSYMTQGYIFFVNNNTSRLIQGTTNDVGTVNIIMTAIFSLVTKILSIICIGGYIIICSPSIALVLLVLAGACMLGIHFMFDGIIRKYGVQLREAERENTRDALEAIQGSKEILVTKRQNFFVGRYEASVGKHIQACIMLDMAALSPTYIIEMVCVVGLLVAIAAQMSDANASMQMIETLSIVAMATFRILPCMSAISSSLNTIRSRMPAFNAAYETIESVNRLERENKVAPLSEDDDSEITQIFKNEIKLNEVSYKYPNTDKYILDKMDFSVKANTSVGIIGSSGAGKSTLVDVMLGLLIPEHGSITMDGENILALGKQWNRNVGYVPQSVYLVDASIRENIAFGIPKQNINDEMVWNALEMAQLADFVRNLKDGLDTQVGERGIKFSGGQKQRVAIARALYLNPEILILDEATAALDNETEIALMESIESLLGKKTLIIIAHRLTTIRKCDFVYEMKDGKIIQRDKAEVLGS